MIRLYTFLVFIAIVAVSFCVIFNVSAPSYERTITLLVKEGVDFDSENVVGDIAFISMQVLQNEEALENYKHTNVSIEKIPDTNILIFTTKAKSSKDLIQAERIALKKVFENISKYYDIKNDISFVVVDKTPINKIRVINFCLYLIIVFSILGIVSGILLLKSIFDKGSGKDQKININAGEIFAHFHDKNFTKDNLENESPFFNLKNIKNNIEKPKEKKADEEKVEIVGNKVKEKSEKTISTKTKISKSMPEGFVATPGNLPVVDASDFGISNNNVITPDNVLEDKKNIEDKEPTEEELKERLNKLLNGDL